MQLSGYIAAARNSGPYAVAALGLLILVLASRMFVGSEGFGYDYLAYDDAARRIGAGAPLYLPDTVEAYAEERYEGLYLYPPPLAIAFVPLTVVDQSAATIAWMALRLLLLIGACLALPVSRRARLVTLGLAGLSFPVLFDLNIGNVSIVVFALCVVAWRWMGTPVAALSHVLLALIRLPMLLFGVLWLAQRRYDALAWTIAVGVVLLLVSVPIVGIATYADYVGILRGLSGITGGEHDLSFGSTLSGLGASSAVAGLAVIVSYVLGLAAVIVAARRQSQSTAFVVTALATLLTAPFVHPHYLVLLLLPAALLMDRGHWWGAGLPLLGWLPDALLPLAGVLAIGLLLVAPDRQPALEAARAASVDP